MGKTLFHSVKKAFTIEYGFPIFPVMLGVKILEPSSLYFLIPSWKQNLLVKYFDSITLKAPYLVIWPLNGFLAL